MKGTAGLHVPCDLARSLEGTLVLCVHYVAVAAKRRRIVARRGSRFAIRDEKVRRGCDIYADSDGCTLIRSLDTEAFTFHQYTGNSSFFILHSANVTLTRWLLPPFN